MTAIMVVRAAVYDEHTIKPIKERQVNSFTEYQGYLAYNTYYTIFFVNYFIVC